MRNLSERKTEIIGIIVAASVVILGWFAEPLGVELIDKLFQTTPSNFIETRIITDNPKAEISSTTTQIVTTPKNIYPINPTEIKSRTPTNTITFTPTFTSTNIPSLTYTLIPGELNENCVSYPWEGKDIEIVDGCLDLSNKGVDPIEHGLKIYAIATTNNHLERLALTYPIKENLTSIIFNLKLDYLQESYREQPTLLYFGIASGDDLDLSGTYILFDKSKDNDLIHSSYLFNQIPGIDPKRRGEEEYKNGEGRIVSIEFIFENNSYQIVKDGSIEYDFLPYSLTSITNPVFVIGYIVGPGGGILSVEILDFLFMFQNE